MSSLSVFKTLRYAISSFVQHTTTEWHSKTKERASNRDFSEYNTYEECTREVLVKAMKTMAHVINRLPRPKLEFISLYENLWNVNLIVSHFYVFDYVCYVSVPSHL